MSTTTQTMSLGSPATAAPAPERASATAWIAVSAAMIGAFMAILNIQITNASLLDIEGGIGTGVDNGAWISTSYLIGEIVVIPLTDYLSRVFSFRRYMLANAVLFPLFSAACAFSHDLGSMIAAARPAGLRRRRAHPDGLHHGADQTAQGAAAARAGAVRALRHLRAGDRPDHRRLSDRELRLAVHLLRQHAAQHHHDRCPVLHAGEEADAAVAAQGGRLGRHRHHGDRAFGAADRARGGQQGGLVPVDLHRQARARRRPCS